MISPFQLLVCAAPAPAGRRGRLGFGKNSSFHVRLRAVKSAAAGRSKYNGVAAVAGLGVSVAGRAAVVTTNKNVIRVPIRINTFRESCRLYGERARPVFRNRAALPSAHVRGPKE